MKTKFLALILVIFSCSIFAQPSDNERLIKLAKAYKDFMFMNEPTKDRLNSLKKDVPENLKVATDFIIQNLLSKHHLLDKEFLTLPNEQTLNSIYIIDQIFQNLNEDDPIDNNKVIENVSKKTISKYELVNNYYQMLFTGVGNKKTEFDMSKVDFQLDQYNLKDDTEKAIFFLLCMNYCRTEIWGYINIVKPANTKKAYEYIKKYPKFNGMKYFQYSDLKFVDFETILEKGKDVESFKKYYIDKYYDLLLYHLLCLNKQEASEKEVNEFLLGSILRDSSYYKFTKNKETLEEIFKEVK
jgi:hypothetical protein